MRVLYFGTYDRAYPRNAQVISALRGAGVEVREQHRAVWERRHNWSVGLRQMLRVAEAERSLRRSRRGRAGRRCADRRLPRALRPARREARRARAAGRLQPARLALRHARRRPRAFPPRLARAQASCTSSTAGRSGGPTSSSRTPRPTPGSFASEFGLCRTPGSRCASSAPRIGSSGPAGSPKRPFHALFVGKLIPLHGLETILAAAALAPEIPFRVVGSGQLEPLLADRPPNVEWVPWVEYDDLPGEIQAAGCALGIFGTGAKAAPGDPEQGIPGARVRHAARDRRHPGRPRAAHRRPRCAPRSRRRRGRARGRRPAPRRRPRAGRRGSAPPAGRRTRRGRARPCSATAGGTCSSGRSLPRDDGRARCSGSPSSAFAAGMSALAVLQQRAFETGPLRRRQPDPGRLVDGARPLPRDDRPPGRARSRASARTSTRSSRCSPRSGGCGRAPSLLLVVQAVAVALGAVPVFLLARKHLGSDWAGLGFALVYLLYPPTQWLVVDDFHPVALATPLLLGAIWFLDEDRLLPFALCAGAACLTKEQIGLVVAMLGLWHARRARAPAGGSRDRGRRDRWSRSSRRRSSSRTTRPAEARRSQGRYAAVGGSPAGIVETAVRPPAARPRGGDRAARPRHTSSTSSRRSAGLPLLSPLARRERPAGARRSTCSRRHANADVDPLPLHGRGHPRARRGRRARGGAGPAASASLVACARPRARRARARCRRRARPAPGLAPCPVRLEARDP